MIHVVFLDPTGYVFRHNSVTQNDAGIKQPTKKCICLNVKLHVTKKKPHNLSPSSWIKRFYLWAHFMIHHETRLPALSTE